MRPGRTTSRSSTGSRCRRIIFRSPVVAVHRGQLELAREHSERALGLAEEQFGLHPPQSTWRSSGSPRSGAETRRRPQTGSARPTGRPPGSGGASRAYAGGAPTTPRRCSSSAAIDDAVRLLDAWEADATRLGREWVLAHVTRCRGLVAAAEGDRRSGRFSPGAGGRAARGRSAIPSAVLVPSLALGVVRRRARQKRAAREATPRPRSAASSSSARRPGSRRPVPSSGASAGARARSGLTSAEQPRRRSGRRGPDEPGGRGDALPRRADGGKPPDAHLRQARRALAHGARPPAAMTNRGSRAKFRRSDVSASRAAP